MKRFTGILAAAAIALAPMSASALEALTDNAMNDVTAQAGVSIALDDVVIYQTGIADTTYTDTDGMSYFDYAGLATGTHFKTEGNVTSAGIMIDYDDAIQKLTIIDGITTAGDYSVANLQNIFGSEIGMVGFVNGADDSTVVASSHIGQNPAFENIAAAQVTSTDSDGDGNIDTWEYNGTVYTSGVTYDSSSSTFTFTSEEITIVDSYESWAQNMDPTTGNVKDSVAPYVTGASPLTIDVGTCKSLTVGFNNNQSAAYSTAMSGHASLGDIAGVIIGLPTIEITSYHTTDTKTVKLVDAVNAPNSGRAFVQITKSGSSKMAILGGRIEIAPH